MAHSYPTLAKSHQARVSNFPKGLSLTEPKLWVLGIWHSLISFLSPKKSGCPGLLLAPRKVGVLAYPEITREKPLDKSFFHILVSRD